MKLTIVSNYETLHTQPLSRELHRVLGNDFAFVETIDRAHDPKAEKMGFAYQYRAEEHAPWIICAWRSEAVCAKARDLLMNSDAVVIANASDEWILPRLRAKKLTFRAHERWYREKLPWYRRPRAIIGGWLHHGRFPSLYLLSASAYTSSDALLAGCFRGKAYKWGYFPEFYSYEYAPPDPLRSNSIPIVLWAGRMIDCKRPMDAIAVCDMLRAEGYRFRLKVAGSGPLLEQARSIAPDWVEFPGALSPWQLRHEMEQSNIFLFTSDRREGWGAVLNEAMNSGCAVVAGHAAGATPYLVRHGENGLLYPSGDLRALRECLRTLLDDPTFRHSLGRRAYETIRDRWSPAVAAERLVALCGDLLEGSVPNFADGPCSAAPVLSDDWFPNSDYF